MKILSLHLTAFGPFTDKDLDFSCGSHGLHLVYGPNEAGKSAALRALVAFLYGIPLKTPDNFLHDYDSMRIGARLRRSDGVERMFIRRKGSRNTLLDQSGAAVDETELARFLDNVPQELFVTMYGIGSEALVKGGVELIQGKGEVGAALFSAASGIPEVRETLSALEARADELFKPRGSNQVINRLIRELEGLRKQRKECSLSAAEFSEIEDRSREALDTREGISGRLRLKTAELSRKKRLLESFGDACELKEIMDELQGMAGITLLAGDFTRRREHVEERLGQEREALDRDTLSLNAVQSEIQTLQVPFELIGNQDRITGLFQESGNYRQANEQLPRIRGNVLEIERAVRRTLRELGLPGCAEGDYTACRLPVRERSRIEELCERHGLLSASLGHESAALTRYEAALSDLKDRLERLPGHKDLASLEELLGVCRRSGLNERSSSSLEAEVKTLEEAWTGRRNRLGLSGVSGEELPSLPVPGRQTVSLFAGRLRDIEQQLADASRQEESELRSLAGIEDDIRTLTVQGAVPTEQDLGQARARRDDLWNMILDAWPAGRAVPEDAWKVPGEEARSLEAAFEQGMERADRISDRLRLETDRVARLAQLITGRDRAVGQAGEAKLRQQDLREAKAMLLKEWEDAWKPAGIRPRTPEEMREWLELFDETAAACREWKAKSAGLAQMSAELSANRQRLIDLITASGGRVTGTSLAALDRRAEELIRSSREAGVQRRELEERIREGERQTTAQQEEVSRIKKALAGWQEAWTSAIAPAGLGPDASPAQARAVVERFTELSVQVRDIEEKTSRIRAIESDNARFEKSVADLAASLGKDMPGAGHVRFIEALQRELKEGLLDHERLKALQRKRQELERSVEAHRDIIAEREDEMQGLLKEAGCDDPARLPEREALCAAYRGRAERAGELKRIISRSAGGADLEAFLLEIEASNPDALPREIVDLEEEMRNLEERRTGVDRVIGSLRKERESITGGSRAALVSEEIESVVAKLKEAVGDYVRLTLASACMREALEQYRKKNQGPVLTRAGDFFRRMTLGSLSGLAADYDGDDRLVLVGLRGDRRVPVEAMSEGTCDQLYLSLRLASLEQRLKHREPLPLILDDILVNFDDDRARQTLEVLSELSERTQVILFTHHEHLSGLARRHISPDRLFIQGL